MKQTRDESSITGPQSVVTLISDFAFLHHVIKMKRIKPLNRGENYGRTLFGTTKRWPWPL